MSEPAGLDGVRSSFEGIRRETSCLSGNGERVLGKRDMMGDAVMLMMTMMFDG